MELEEIVVAVHDGQSHGDEIFAIAVLKRLFGLQVIRSRKQQDLQQASMRVDVGGRYDPSTNDFDHHQPDAPRRENGIKYAAFGLVWKTYGARICESAEVAETVDRLFIQACDAADNGETPWSACGHPQPFTVAFMMETFHPTWLETENEETAFANAVVVAGVILDRAIAYARAIVQARKTILDASKASEDPRILVLPQKIPWQETVINELPEVRYVIYDEVNYWSMRSVPLAFGTPDPKYPVPQAWAGKTGAELQQAAGIPGALFCHVKRFIATADSLQGVLALAKLACDTEG